MTLTHIPRALHADLSDGAVQAARARRLLLVAALIVGCFWIDLVGPVTSPWTLPVRAAWALLFLACAGHLRRGRPGGLRATAYLVATGSAVAIVLSVALTGGTGSGMFPWVLAIPLCGALLVPEDWDAVAWSGILAMAGGAVLCGTNGLPAWLGSSGAAAVLGTWLARRICLQRDEALAANHARESALAELAESEKRRDRSERLATVGTLAAGVAHEVNNPLAYVRANLAFLERALVDEEELSRDEHRQILAESLVGVERIRQIVSDLQSFARAEQAVGETADVRAAAEEALRLSSLRTHGVAEVVTGIAEGLPLVRGSQPRLVQVLTNLLVNAGDALAEGPVREPLIRLLAARTDTGVALTIEDGGPGLPERVRRHLFEPFVTTKPPGRGTGLGLAMSREYVTQLGGTIAAGERPGGGTRFVIDLPAAHERRSSVA